MPQVELAPGDVERFRHGVAVPVAGSASGRCVVFGTGELLGLADVDAGVARPARLLAEPMKAPVSS